MSTHAFVLVAGQPDAYGRIYGPQGKHYVAIGTADDGCTIGVSEVYPSELAIIASPAHEGEYLGRRWEDLLHGPHAGDVDWQVAVKAPPAEGGERWMPEREVPDETILTTPAGNQRRKPPIEVADAASFDPDWMPRIGTVRVVEVDAGEDVVQVVKSGADGVRRWATVQTT